MDFRKLEEIEKLLQGKYMFGLRGIFIPYFGPNRYLEYLRRKKILSSFTCLTIDKETATVYVDE